MSEDSEERISPETKMYLNLVEGDPDNWVLRKEAALKLYSEGKFTMAADMVWNTSEIPSTDMDVAFAVKMLSRAKPNRSIRLVYELLRQNSGKAEQAIAMANVFNLIGYPMLASRCYGAAVSLNAELFDIGFEGDSFWCDEQRVLEKKQQEAGIAKHMHFALQGRELQGEPIRFEDLEQEVDQESFKNASEAAALGDVTDLVPAFEKLQVVMQPDLSKNVNRKVVPIQPEAKTPSGGDHAALYADRVGVAPQVVGSTQSTEAQDLTRPKMNIPQDGVAAGGALKKAVPPVPNQTPPKVSPTRDEETYQKLKDVPVPVLRINKQKESRE
ncbi:hypothetical protein ACFPK9_00775 [Rubritalea spongiae]|uniref:HEAT repeat domain-containing protein n=1 Tax=Rubritalea spongiae TaxID=430797 RepID=A0ABW5EBH1_9BACT